VTTVYGCGTNSTNSTLRYKYSTAKEKESEEIFTDIQEDPYTVYPNPSSGIIYVEANSGFDNVQQIAVYDIMGKLVKNIQLPSKPDNIYGIDLGANPAGYYMVRIIGQEPKEFKVLLTK